MKAAGGRATPRDDAHRYLFDSAGQSLHHDSPRRRLMGTAHSCSSSRSESRFGRFELDHNCPSPYMESPRPPLTYSGYPAASQKRAVQAWPCPSRSTRHLRGTAALTKSAISVSASGERAICRMQ
jgi:hypothetical protein